MSEKLKLHREVKASVKAVSRIFDSQHRWNGWNPKDLNPKRRAAVTFSRSSSKYTVRKHTQLNTRLPTHIFEIYFFNVQSTCVCVCVYSAIDRLGTHGNQIEQTGYMQRHTRVLLRTHTHLRCLNIRSDCSTTLYSFGFLSSVRCMCLVVCYKSWQWVSNLAVTNPLLNFDRVTAKLKFLRITKETITTDKVIYIYWIKDLTSSIIQNKIQ